MIRGDKVVLRAIEPEDIKQLWEWTQDEETMRLRNFPAPPMSFAQAAKEYTDDAREDQIRLAITTLEGELIGEIALWKIDYRSGNADFTIAIGNKEYWGHGYGTDATRTLMRYAFEQLNLQRINLYVHSFNERAINAYERCGFQIEGCLRGESYMDGKRSDVLVMGLLRDEFIEAYDFGKMAA